MFKCLLVPLDGSRLAESVLPTVAFIAQKLNASVTLIHVIEKDAPTEIHGERHLQSPAEAEQYLKNIAQSAFPPSIHIESHVHTSEVSNVSRSIVEHTDELAPDLIIMCSHGKSGFHDWLFGSIAQQVIATGNTPVLLIQPGEKDDVRPVYYHQILLPLDGNPDHERCFQVAQDLARSCQASIHLLVVVPTVSSLKAERAATGLLLPATMAAMLEISEENAREYLAGHVIQLEQEEIPTVAEVRKGNPVGVIIDTSNRIKADLIVLGTHGKVGQEAFWAGSVAARVAKQTRTPLLLVPVRENKK